MKINYPRLLLFIFISTLCSCSSMMTHSGSDQGYYPGTRANNQTIMNDHQSWMLTSLALLDYPFTVVMDTLLLPWDFFNKNSKGHQSLKSEVDALAIPKDKIPNNKS